MRKILLPLLIALCFLGGCLLLARTQADQNYLQSQQFKLLYSKVMTQAQAKHPDNRLIVHVFNLPINLKPDLSEQQTKWHSAHSQTTSKNLGFDLIWDETKHRDILILKLDGQSFMASRTRIRWTAALPPMVAVAVALMTRRLVLSLFLGVLSGSILAADFNPVRGGIELITRHSLAAVGDFFHIQILLFAGFLLGMVGIMNVSGGTRGIIEALHHFVSNRRSTKLITCIMGLLVFFDDYANSFVIGTTMRPITDKLKISREKLAYLVDSTAAPVSGLAIISTWIGYEVGLFQQVLEQIPGMKLGGYQAFIQALPFRFYCILALAMVFLVVLMRRDFGPMYHAEMRALEQGLVLRDGGIPLTSKTFNGMEAKEGIPLRWQNAAIPVGAVVIATLLGLFLSGGGFQALQKSGIALFHIQVMGQIFSNANSGQVLFWASIIGCGLAAVMVWVQGLLNPLEIFQAWLKGVSSILLASVILVFAWMLNNVAADIGTAAYLIAIFRNVVQPLWLPLLIFVLSGAIAFSTGSSWSTMAILIPVAVPLAYEIGGPVLMIIAMGAVLDGSIFGDHCSPLSDTTILSSISCSCDHLDHVKTQFPYAMLVMVVAALCCYLPAAAGMSPYPLILLGILVLSVFLRGFGRDPEADHKPPDLPVNHLKKIDPQFYAQD